MLISWYDRDRDFESPQHSSECHQDSAVPGYVDYGIHHGAKLKVDFEQGRFVFFYRCQPWRAKRRLVVPIYGLLPFCKAL
ncbi:MAG: AF1514 family protein [Gammaproteobacteria bacterium]|nr:AF1514 family protein [Gammaproteobacteria bacterium]